MKKLALALKREISHLEKELKNAELPSRRKEIELLIVKADTLLLQILWSN